MSPEREQLIRDSWAALQPHATGIARSFYEHLFEIDPRTRQLFATTDMTDQQMKFMAMLGEIVVVLDQPERLVSELADSGRRHVGYGAEDRDYDTVGVALLWALKHELGDAFTPELSESWQELYGLVAAVMRRAAARAQSAV